MVKTDLSLERSEWAGLGWGHKRLWEPRKGPDSTLQARGGFLEEVTAELSCKRLVRESHENRD